MIRDFADFLAALNKNGVDYVVIGGNATDRTPVTRLGFGRHVV